MGKKICNFRLKMRISKCVIFYMQLDHMTYNVFGGTLSLTQSVSPDLGIFNYFSTYGIFLQCGSYVW